MDAIDAQRAIESLRLGIPPDGYLRHFTVGRQAEVMQIELVLAHGEGSALLIQADYGIGKTHLLRNFRELALDAGYAVSLVTLDAKSGVRFSRLDEIVGQISRRLETPSQSGPHGIRQLFDRAIDTYNHPVDDVESFWHRLSNGARWDYDRTGQLQSPAMFIALRAWFFGDNETADLIEDWLFQPGHYLAQQKTLYRRLVSDLRHSFRDPRTERQIAAGGVFDFTANGYQHGWEFLSDLDLLSRACRYKGFVLLIDEFEDAIANTSRQSERQDAFWNLFQFFGGAKFGGFAIFAVTPSFVHDCKDMLLRENFFDYDYSQFDQLPMLTLPPLQLPDVLQLAEVIAETHRLAYGTTAGAEFAVDAAINLAMQYSAPASLRQTIRAIVNLLDESFSETMS